MNHLAHRAKYRDSHAVAFSARSFRAVAQSTMHIRKMNAARRVVRRTSHAEWPLPRPRTTRRVPLCERCRCAVHRRFGCSAQNSVRDIEQSGDTRPLIPYDVRKYKNYVRFAFITKIDLPRRMSIPRNIAVRCFGGLPAAFAAIDLQYKAQCRQPRR